MTSSLQAPSLPDRLTPPGDTSQNSLIVSLSTVFYPGAHALPQNLIFSSQDSVYFYVHTSVFSGPAKDAFRSVLSAPLSDPQYQRTIIHVPETSEVLNIIFHTIYDMSCLKHSPSFDTSMITINRMSIYDLNPKDYMGPSGTLRELLLHFLPQHPLEIYATAAHYDVHDIAEAASGHLLSYPLNTIGDDIVTRMGAVYLKRLLSLHASRSEALKHIVMLPPAFHTPNGICTYDDQGKLSRAWILTAAYLVWDAQPGISIHSLEAAFLPLKDLLICPECRQVFSTRVDDVTQQWSRVKHTI